jgi:hypothetical protein
MRPSLVAAQRCLRSKNAEPWSCVSGGRQEIWTFLPDLVMGSDGRRSRPSSLRHGEDFFRPHGLKWRSDRGFYQPLMNGPIDNVASA